MEKGSGWREDDWRERSCSQNKSGMMADGKG